MEHLNARAPRDSLPPPGEPLTEPNVKNTHNAEITSHRRPIPEMTMTSALVCSPFFQTTKPLPINSRPPLFIEQRPMVPFSSSSSTSRPSQLKLLVPKENSIACNATRRSSSTGDDSISQEDGSVRKTLQYILWAAEGIYILWLFLLPYAPGDPVWAISSDTVNSLVGLSLNFFFILPLMNAVGIRLIDAPVVHPISEGLFNFVIGWTFMFAPLLFTDRKRDRYSGSLDILWGFQMFLTNTFLIPYMAIRLNGADAQFSPRKTSQLGSIMTKGAAVVGLIGGAVCLISTFWALFGRADGNFGNLTDRWEFLVSYLGSERLAYAFIWDICLYIIFQPWLIGDNLQNVQEGKTSIVNYLRFVPVIGLVAYLLCLNLDEEP